MRNLAYLTACLVLTTFCSADTFIVDPNGSADFTTIQDAIDHSWDGDTIIARKVSKLIRMQAHCYARIYKRHIL